MIKRQDSNRSVLASLPTASKSKMPTSSVLVSKHPRIENVNPHTFDYENYGFEHIRVKLDEGVLVVTLYRPDNYNSFTNEMCHSLVFAFELADADDRVKAVVLTGHGKLFCAGADLNLGGGASFGADDDRSIKDHRDGGGQVTLSIAHCRKLVIAAVNGSAVGIGATMQLPCDIRIISSTAKIAFPFAKRGITTEACSAFYLPRLVGTSKALELVMTADTYKPDYPALLPLWREILPAEQVFPKSLELAKRLIKENSVVSMAIMKSLIYRAPDNPEETHLVDSQAIAATSAGDAVEGVKSFMEKRPASFKGTIKDLEKMPFYPWWTQIATDKTIRGAKL